MTLGAVHNNGVIEAFDDRASSGAVVDLVFGGALTGVGVAEVGPNNVTLDGSAGIYQTLNFNTGATDLTPTLFLNDPSEFAATIAGFDRGAGADDRIELNSTSGAAWQFQGFGADGLMFTNGTATASISLAGSYNAADFHAAISGSATTITYGA